MAKAVGGFFRFLFGLLILGIVGYNSWQVTLLRAEVNQLKHERATVIKQGESVPVSDSGPSSLLEVGRRHMERARGFLRTNQYSEARRELAKATEALERGSRQAQQGGAAAAAQTRAAIRSLTEQVETLWGRSNGSKESEKKP